MNIFQASVYQQAIFDALPHDQGHLVVKAAAGSGKSTMLREGLELYTSGDLLPAGRNVLVTAFNTAVVDDFNRKSRRDAR